MAIAAVPAYLGQDFSKASPGLRFGMFLPLWGVDSRTGDRLWTTHDLNERPAGPQHQVRQFKDENKTAALRHTTSLTDGDRAAMSALLARQQIAAAPLASGGQLLCAEALAVAPFTTGLGNEHPLENGFAFLNPYGLPYLPGSGVKGVLRQAARELADGEWGDANGWTRAAIGALFGMGSGSGDDEVFQRGALEFWDVIPQIAGNALQVEIMTPHMTHYLQNGATPHESGQPNPINFLTVPPGSRFVFHVRCDLPFLSGSKLAPELARDGRWQALLTAAMAHAFQWLGFGAKTAVGYGAMREDEEARRLREKEAAERQRALVAKAEAEEEAKQTPHEREAKAAGKKIGEFRALLDAEQQTGRPRPGSPFDQSRAVFLKLALTWQAAEVRSAAATVLRESYKFTDWPGKKERKQEVKQWLTQLDGQS